MKLDPVEPENEQSGLPSSKYVSHSLVTTNLGTCISIVPRAWGEHAGFVLVKGAVAGKRSLVRIQSRCAYGEVFGSRQCDCGPQIDRACAEIKTAGAGIVFYLEQEGRSAGLLSKALAYREADRSGMRTFDFYEQAGIGADPRQYDVVVDVLKDLSVDRVTLMTGNLAKADALVAGGIDVEITPLNVELDPASLDYVLAKRNRGHLI